VAAVALASAPLPRKLRVGLYADAELQPRWLAQAFAKVAACGFAEITVIAIEPRRGEARAQARPSYLDRKLFLRSADPDELLELARYVPHQRKLAGSPGASLLPLDLDVVFALGAVDDVALDGVARYGVWRFCADAIREVVNGEPVTRSALLARIAPGAEPRLVYQSWSCTDPVSIARNRARVLAKTSEFAWRALREAQRSGHGWLEQCKIQRQGELPQARSGGAWAEAVRLGRRTLQKALYREQCEPRRLHAHRAPARPHLGRSVRGAEGRPRVRLLRGAHVRREQGRDLDARDHPGGALDAAGEGARARLSPVLSFPDRAQGPALHDSGDGPERHRRGL
jgi:hypothetical protein